MSVFHCFFFVVIRNGQNRENSAKNTENVYDALLAVSYVHSDDPVATRPGNHEASFRELGKRTFAPTRVEYHEPVSHQTKDQAEKSYLDSLERLTWPARI